MKKKRCIIIPAIKKSAVIPDQLVKKLAGVTLIQRAINTARTIAEGTDIYIITDSEEISLICLRNEVSYRYRKTLRLTSSNIIQGLKEFAVMLSEHYHNIIIYRASAPLVTGEDIERGYALFKEKKADILVTLKEEEHRIWREGNGNPSQLIHDESREKIFFEIKSFLVLSADALNGEGNQHKVVPYFLGDKAVEINGYQDWWICEKLLRQKTIVFVVTGYPAIGLGHVYRALTLAREISDHRIIFLCTAESDLAVKGIAERDYNTVLQARPLHEDVLALNPDLVINDILDTDAAYVGALKSQGLKVVNFEDSGPGAAAADLVINALYSPEDNFPENCLCGPQYFCLRDEFAEVHRGRFRKEVDNVLVTFGGTDPGDYTLRTLQAIQEICEANNIQIFAVTGPGYLHKDSLVAYLDDIPFKGIQYINKTGIMSSIMEKADLTISSAGRTVYELAHMRVPAIVMAQHAREHTHTFARPENGFEYIGVMNDFDAEKLRIVFLSLLNPENRRLLYERMKPFNFAANKKKVVKTILSYIEGP